ncbi:hypothetical protein BCON_0648g00010 [Botryotinia convoluta]|uniref:Aminotransferase class I/classII large domain-containing protein n=1 Tax=Botryotinia convoluta TaxID=54673 RepID=A0A4Z1HFW8_9HELO|nr:hypothetical protein BCON_0648g00010 [Botryotinia convoluta]
MAPSSTEIKAIFDTVYQGGITQDPFSNEPERLRQFLSPNAKIHIIGEDFPLAIQSNNLDTVIANVASPMHSLLDTNKPSKTEVIRVIGGGNDSWAALDCKPFIHAFVYVVHFDSNGKISEVKGFFDTLHVHNHFCALMCILFTICNLSKAEGSGIILSFSKKDVQPATMDTTLEMYARVVSAQELQASKVIGQPYFYQVLEARLDELRCHKKLRTLRLRRQNVIDFSSSDVLSLSSSGILRDRFLEELAAHPNFSIGSGGSRLLDGTNSYVEDLETELCEYFGAECGLLFGSGFNANGAIFSTIPNLNDVIVYDEFVHRSIHDGMRRSKATTRMPFLNNSVKSLEDVLTKVKESDKLFDSGLRNVLIAVESIYSMDGSICPIVEMIEVAKRLFPLGNAVFIIDEAHATGVIGPRGSGLIRALGLEKEMVIRVHTFGKAMATNGAIVLGSRTIRNYLINFSAEVIYTAGLSFPTLAGIRCALRLLSAGQTEEKALESGTLRIPFPNIHKGPRAVTHVVPIIAESSDSLSFHLQMRNYVAWPVEYPIVPKGQSRVRLVFHAINTMEQVDGLTEAIEEWLEAQPDSSKAFNIEEAVSSVKISCADANEIIVSNDEAGDLREFLRNNC